MNNLVLATFLRFAQIKATAGPKPEPVLVEPIKHPSYDKEVLVPFHTKRDEALSKLKTDCETQGGTAEEFTCVIPPPPPPPPEPAALISQASSAASQGVPSNASAIGAGGLTGSFGYALAGGNCVDEFGVNNPGWGNPIDWPVLYSTPAIGETVLFTYNHTGRIVGLWSNGDVEIRHRNWHGTPQTRFPRSAFRGFR